jgi:hypothetical protein
MEAGATGPPDTLRQNVMVKGVLVIPAEIGWQPGAAAWAALYLVKSTKQRDDAYVPVSIVAKPHVVVGGVIVETWFEFALCPGTATSLYRYWLAFPIIGNVTLVTPAAGVQPLAAAVLLLAGAIVAAEEILGTFEDKVIEFAGVEEPPVQYWRINDDVEPLAFVTTT